MNILHISRTMGQGGAEKIVYQLCKDIDGYKQIIASNGGIYTEELRNVGIKHFQIPDIAKKNPVVVLKTFFILRSIVYHNNVDIIHTHHRMAAFYARLIQIFHRKVKHVYTAHNVFYGKSKLMRFALENAVVVAVGDGVKRNLMAEYKISESRIHVIYNAVDTSHISNYRNERIEKLINEENYVIGTIGRLSEQKGMDIFIQAMKIVSEKIPKLKAVVIGDGELKDELQRMVSELELQKTIYFLGYQSHILEIIGQLQFIVLASRWEGLPLTPIETFSQGKTIIATDIPGNNEVIKDGENGILIAEGDYEELADQIINLANDSVKKIKLEDSASRTYITSYCYHDFIDKYKKIYDKGGLCHVE